MIIICTIPGKKAPKIQPGTAKRKKLSCILYSKMTLADSMIIIEGFL